MGGTMDEASIFRWVPSMYSMTPSFKLNIRQNHFTGSAKKLHQEARKQKMQANIPVPAFTKTGMNAHDFHDDHYEEEFEFDLNLIDGLKVELCTPAMVTDVSTKLQSLNQALPPGKVFGRISFTVKKGERPMYRRPLCSSFTPNTTQAKFAGAVRSLKKYSIFVNLTKPNLLKAFNCYKDVILAGRYLSFDGIPRDDWYWSRFEAYQTDKPSRFQDYIDDSESEFPRRPWLITVTPRGGIKHNQAYDTTSSKLPRGQFTTMKSYEEHYMAALLYERDEVREAKKLIFNYTIRYLAKFSLLSGIEYTIGIKLKGDIAVQGVAKIIPSPHTTIAVLLADISNPEDNTTYFEGEVCALTPPGFDFAVLASLPTTMQGDENFHLEDGAERAVHVLWRGKDLDAERKMAAVREACAYGEEKEPHLPLEDMNGLPRGLFCLRNIIADQELTYYSFPLIDLFTRDNPTKTATTTTVRALPAANNLNTRQTLFIDTTMNGVLAAILLLLGFPGTGKSKTLGTMATQCGMMGFRVLLVSQSNKGVDAVFEGTTGVMQLSGQGNLLERCVRVMSEFKETALAQEIPNVVALMRNKILATAKIVGYTAFVATTLANTDYEPDILIFDEAGQATDPDLIMALLGNMTRLKKVILGGDPAQLPPVVGVYPHFSRIELNENYRGHHSTFAASSKIFYDGKMIAGDDPARWNTALATKVYQLLSNQDFAGAYRNRNAAIDPENRQVFINVPGISEPEPEGTLYYNPNGVMATAIFVQMLVDSGVMPKDIGIISMYSEDVRRIRQELANRGIKGVEVSTVDGYQGSEKEVMVVHFVAAFPGRQDPFAFVKRPQRLNVASYTSATVPVPDRQHGLLDALAEKSARLRSIDGQDPGVDGMDSREGPNHGLGEGGREALQVIGWRECARQ
ncbi:hypothetical protein LTR56_012701 [Elasticomyces elasticus]|nr:hypothetical protein LTR22_022665 [Elasticomyces elasticus]KAK3638978.1 hypothetical protein LTR56_012701 [Elasticomyces elasticus]KAK4918768.1 hypothetical protein LTR49_013555 [Elasticomyces elasticus]KAK5754403.1 hypothetical protein LTS12_015472 [Elasticomyces elasticus]